MARNRFGESRGWTAFMTVGLPRRKYSCCQLTRKRSQGWNSITRSRMNTLAGPSATVALVATPRCAVALWFVLACSLPRSFGNLATSCATLNARVSRAGNGRFLSVSNRRYRHLLGPTLNVTALPTFALAPPLYNRYQHVHLDSQEHASRADPREGRVSPTSPHSMTSTKSSHVALAGRTSYARSPSPRWGPGRSSLRLRVLDTATPTLWWPMGFLEGRSPLRARTSRRGLSCR